MYSFIGYKCPVCSLKFDADSDIVVCPDCGAPYHRECYQKNAACLFAARHSEGYIWEADENNDGSCSGTSFIVCPACGQKCPSESRFCLRCGKVLKSSSADSDEAFEGYALTWWKAYIGKSNETYLNIFKKLSSSKHAVSFNISAMILGPLYFWYRKIWSWAILFSVVYILLNLPYLILMLAVSGNSMFSSLDINVLAGISNTCSILSWVVMALRGLFANKMYEGYILNLFSYVKENVEDKDIVSLLGQAGGTSILPALLFIILVTAIETVVALNMGPDMASVLRLMGL